MIENSKLINRKVGKKLVLAQERFILRSGEPAAFDFVYQQKGNPLRMVFTVSQIPPRSEMAEATWHVIDNGIQINFCVASTSPVIIKGSSALGKFDDGGNLEFYAEIYRYGDNHVLFIQLMNNKD